MEGDVIEYSCSVKYRGIWAPTMTWTNGTDALLAKNESVGNIVKFTTAITLMRWDNERHFNCRTFFDKPRKGTLPINHADNFPINNNDYAQLWRVPALTVYCEYKSHHSSAHFE